MVGQQHTSYLHIHRRILRGWGMHARCCWRSIYYNDNYYDSAMLASQTLLASLHKDHILLGSDPKIWIWISADRKSVGLTVVGTAQTNRFVASIVCNQNSSRRERKETLLHTIIFLFFMGIEIWRSLWISRLLIVLKTVFFF